LQYAREAVNIASDMQATDIHMLEVSDVCSFTDFFVIVSSDNRRQMSALSEELTIALKKLGAVLHHKEGSVDSGWILLDLGSVLIHVFATEVREHYRLGELWSSGRTVVKIQ